MRAMRGISGGNAGESPNSCRGSNSFGSSSALLERELGCSDGEIEKWSAWGETCGCDPLTSFWNVL